MNVAAIPPTSLTWRRFQRFSVFSHFSQLSTQDSAQRPAEEPAASAQAALFSPSTLNFRVWGGETDGHSRAEVSRQQRTPRQEEQLRTGTRHMLQDTKCQTEPNSPGWLRNVRDTLQVGLSQRQGDTSTSLGEMATLLVTASLSDQINLITISHHLHLSHQLKPAICLLAVFCGNSRFCWDDHKKRDERPGEAQLPLLSLLH